MLIDKVISRIKNYQKFLLMIHEDPDGDTLAATVAIFLALKSLTKDVWMVCKDPIPKPFLFLNYYYRLW
jgi:phosphoesterase RecJ-like protein